MSKVKIMVVEDEAIVAEDIKHMLLSLDYDVPALAASGDEAITKIKETSPQLVLMDIMLKGDKDGVSVAEHIQYNYGIPVVYLTAYADDYTLERAKITEPYGYIIKPFEKKELYTTIEIALYKYNMERTLIESEKKYRTLFEDSGDAMYISNKDGRFIDVNQSALDLFGYTREEILKLNIRDLYQNIEDRTGITEEIEKQGQIRSYEINFKTKSGKVIPCLLTSTKVRSDVEEAIEYQGIIRDITERKEKEEALKEKAESIGKRFKELQCLYSISNLVEKPDITLDEIIKGTVSLIPEALSYPNIVNVRVRMEDKEYTTNNFYRTEWKQNRDISIRGEKIGDLEVCYKENKKSNPEKDEDAFMNQEKILFSVIAERIGKIIEQVTVEEELKQSLEKLKAITEGIIKAMATTTELKDPYTAGHQKRVSKLSVEIAKKLGLSDDNIEGIRMAGLIHDIGKISVPAEILSKPGELSEHEFNIIKTHSQVGYDILKTIDFPWPIADIILQHHERIDGSGYPYGLGEKDILLEAQIITVADVIDAMASHRPYRPALGINEAFKEISKNKGIKYNSKVVDICLELYEKKEFDFEIYGVNSL
jgi:PAS domain S-box-containing protein/putative nucleotidyltransferase with HDIG domain